MRYPELWQTKCRGMELAERSVASRLVQYASNRSGEGWIAFPAINTIAMDLDLSYRYVQRKLDTLEAKLFISSKEEFRNNKQRSNKYKLHVDRLYPPGEKSDHILAAIKTYLQELM